MPEYKIVIDGQPPSKKTSPRFITSKRGRTILLPNKEYVEWEPRAIWAVKVAKMEAGIEPLVGRLHVWCLFYRTGRGRIDLTNMMQSAHDVLTMGEFIKDDSLIESVDGSRKVLGVPANEARTEIFVSEMKDDQ